DARAFALGMVALVNPCGFALLPAYLGYFLGLNDGDERESRIVALNRAQVVGLSMSVGFLAVFGVIGLALAGIISSIVDFLPWVTLVMGFGLLALGASMLFGFQPLLSLPKLEKGTGSRSTASMFLFGVSYALASLTCTIPLFLSAVGTSAANNTFGERFGGFVSYGIGMGLMATGLTLAVAFGKKGMVNSFRQLLPKINLISAVVLVIVGAYVAWYGYWSTDPINIPAGPVRQVESWQASLSGWIDDRTAILGWGFLAVNVAVGAAGFIARRSTAAKTTEPSEPASV
ncbi:MAG: cytochrome c biogenesis CcdA family protein, partial [Acidimicrobiia bacterium]|nr:cytochrome c biogenesis CcdA family protein [Acidimicrobiia bacterium]